MTNTNATRPAVDMREIINAAAATCVVADYMVDDFSESAYISDIIGEGADDAVDIYYKDLLDFVRENPEALAEVVAEGLYCVDSHNPYDFWAHVRTAEFWQYEREAYENLADIHHGIAAWHILHVHELKEIPADAWDEIKAAIDADTPDTYGDIWETVDAIINPDDEDDDGDEYMQPLTVTTFDAIEKAVV